MTQHILRASGRGARVLSVFVLTLAACGGRSSLETAGGGEGGADEGPAVLPPDVAPPLAGCALPAIVPTGKVWVGEFEVSVVAGTLVVVPADCEEHYFGAKRFNARRVFLDMDEATNECYAHCVEAGACQPPAPISDIPEAPYWGDPVRRPYPARTDPERAEAFCAFRGGRLPTLAELARARLGSLRDFCDPELRETYSACLLDFQQSEACEDLLEREDSRRNSYAVHPIRTYPADVGPFGHHDLFGSRTEHTASLVMTEEEAAAYCDLSNAPPNTGSGPLNYLFDPLDRLVGVAAGLHAGYAMGAVYSTPSPIAQDGNYTNRAVRCAYDPLEL